MTFYIDRSTLMSNIRGKDNKATELRLISIMRENGIIGWRRHQPLIGRPDFVFRKFKIAIFVDGCFWHGCPRCYRAPKSNQTFWEEKLSRNRARDRKVTRELRRAGWRVIRIWEHSLNQPAAVARRLVEALDKGAATK